MNTTKEVQLPTVPSQLLRLALDDLRKVERSKRYAVDMGSWHEPNQYDDKDNRVCAVCFTGALLKSTRSIFIRGIRMEGV